MGRLNWTEQFLTKNQNLMRSERGASRRISTKAANDTTFPQWLIWFSNEEHHRWSGEETHRPLRCHGCMSMNPYTPFDTQRGYTDQDILTPILLSQKTKSWNTVKMGLCRKQWLYVRLFRLTCRDGSENRTKSSS